MSDNKQFQEKWNLLKHSKYTLHGEAWKDNKKRPSLRMVLWENNPRFRLYLNDDKNKGSIPFALDPVILQEFFGLIRYVTTNKETSRFSYDIKSKNDHRGVKFDKPTTIEKIFVGRDSEGVVFIAFMAKDMPLAKFPFTHSPWAELYDASGEKLSPVKLSEMRANAWVDAMNLILGQVMVTEGKEYIKNDQSNNKKSGTWSGNKPSAPSSNDFGSEDIDF